MPAPTSSSFYTGGPSLETIINAVLAELAGQVVTSFETRVGTVVSATGDYTASEIANVPAGSIAADNVQAALNELDSEKAPTSHTHAIIDVTGLQAALDLKAPLASPTLTGVPAAPTAAPGTNTTQLATTAFVEAATSGFGSGDVSGPASATDNAVARFDLATGKLIQNSALIVTDAGLLSSAAYGSGFLKSDGSGNFTSAAATGTITYVIDGGGVAITTGEKGDLEIPFACTITAATLLADQAGSIVVDIWKDTYANAPPTVADTITASAKPTLSTADKSQDTTLTGWTTTVNAGDVLRFKVDSATTVQRVTLSLKITRTS
jgi:hypothetical protein